VYISTFSSNILLYANKKEISECIFWYILRISEIMTFFRNCHRINLIQKIR
jgi:hypothetical protein